MHCLACKAQIPQSSTDDYVRCLNCGSYCINSPSESAAANIEYFDHAEQRDVSRSKFRQLIMRIFSRLDRYRDGEDVLALHALDMYINEIAARSKRVLEIGFGNGAWLDAISRHNPNVYGVDLSPVTVSEFQKAFPKLAGRVTVGSEIQGTYDFIYANALFEHLDEPDDFLDKARHALSENGRLVLGFPIVSDEEPGITPQEDINFWSPCHRIIFSLQGFKEIAARKGFQILQFRSIDMFAYRVMNGFLQRHYREIHEYRDPMLDYSGAPGNLLFLRILWTALSMKSYSKWLKIILVPQAEITTQ